MIQRSYPSWAVTQEGTAGEEWLQSPLQFVLKLTYIRTSKREKQIYMFGSLSRILPKTFIARQYSNEEFKVLDTYLSHNKHDA